MTNSTSKVEQGVTFRPVGAVIWSNSPYRDGNGHATVMECGVCAALVSDYQPSLDRHARHHLRQADRVHRPAHPPTAAPVEIVQNATLNHLTSGTRMEPIVPPLDVLRGDVIGWRDGETMEHWTGSPLALAARYLKVESTWILDDRTEADR